MRRAYRLTSFVILGLHGAAAFATDYAISGHVDNLIGNNLQLKLVTSACVASFATATIPSTGDVQGDAEACTSQCCADASSNVYVGPTQTTCTCGHVIGRPTDAAEPDAVTDTQTITVPIHSTSFVFSALFPGTTDYIVTIAAQPANPKLLCAVASGIGQAGINDTTNIAVSCVDRIFKNGFDP